MIASQQPAGSPDSPVCAGTTVTLPNAAAATVSRRLCSRPGSISVEKTCPPGPTAFAKAIVNWPLPAPTSATTIPVLKESASSSCAISGPVASKPNPCQVVDPKMTAPTSRSAPPRPMIRRRSMPIPFLVLRVRLRSPNSPRLQPAADARLVVAVSDAESLLEIRLLTRHDSVADHDCQRQREYEDPRTRRSGRDTPIDEEHADVNRVAAPAVNTGRDQRADGPVGGHRCNCAREI